MEISVVAQLGNDQFDLIDRADLAILVLELARRGDPSFRLVIDDAIFRATYLQPLAARRVKA